MDRRADISAQFQAWVAILETLQLNLEWLFRMQSELVPGHADVDVAVVHTLFFMPRKNGSTALHHGRERVHAVLHVQRFCGCFHNTWSCPVGSRTSRLSEWVRPRFAASSVAARAHFQVPQTVP